VRAGVFRRYLLPGFVFQSVVIAGGYGTGRELVEFFLSYGPLAGLLAMTLVSTVIWSAVCVVSFELARLFRVYDYRHFFKVLLGRWWWLFEVCYVALLLIVLAVIAAAAGEILRDAFGLPYAVGVVGMMLAVGALVFSGTGLIERFLAGWSFVLYATYAVLFVWAVARFGPEIRAAFVAGPPVGLGWVRGGVEYAAYNLAVIPPVLFAVHHIERRREAVAAGLLAGPIAMTPALLFYVAIAGHYPAVVDEAVPATYLLDLLGSPAFFLVFQVVLFGTLIETGTGLIHAVNERIAGLLADRREALPRWVRPAVALALLATGAAVARFGLVALIARGYGTLTWGFLLVFVVPALTVGVRIIRRHEGEPRVPASTPPVPAAE
jgi:uncharacterized membrane protein YkvI